MDVFSDRLLKLRLEKGLNQADLAQHLNTSRSSYNIYENGRTPPVDVVMACASYFDVSTDYLLGLSSDRKPAGDSLSRIIGELAPLATAQGARPITAADMYGLVGQFVKYYQHGAPAGNTPLALLHQFFGAMDGILVSTVNGSTAEVLLAVNEMGTTILDVNNIMTAYLDEDGATLQYVARGGDVSKGTKRIKQNPKMERELRERKSDLID